MFKINKVIRSYNLGRKQSRNTRWNGGCTVNGHFEFLYHNTENRLCGELSTLSVRQNASPRSEITAHLFKWRIQKSVRDVSTHSWPAICGENRGQLHDFRCLLRQFRCVVNIGRIILWRIGPSLGNGSVNTFPKHTYPTIGYPLLGNGPINTHYWQKGLFSVGSVTVRWIERVRRSITV
jgi:hypothetical protein